MKIKSCLSLLFMGATLLLSSSVNAVENGKPAPAFTLTDANGKSVSLSDYKGKFVVLEWVNHGCPFVKKHYESGNMQHLQNEYTGKGVVWLSIASSAKGKQGYLSREEWKSTLSEAKSGATHTLIDADGTVGKRYDAKTTPHMYVVDKEGMLIYQGAIDSDASYRASGIKGAKNYVRAALDEAMAGKKVTVAATEAYGCSVKY